MIYTRKVEVLCEVCKENSVTDLSFGEDERYPEDFYIDCPNCDNSESGSLPTQSFEIVAEL